VRNPIFIATLLRFSATKWFSQFEGGIEMYNLVKTILKTAVYVMDQAERASGELRDRAEKVSDKVSDAASDLADQGRSMIVGEDHTARNVLLFAAGVGVGVGVGMLLAPSAGYELRSSMRDKVEDIGDRVRSQFTPATRARATGTEGGI
jgi:gas vesicle protein